MIGITIEGKDYLLLEDVKNYIKEEFGKDIEIKVTKRLGFSIGIKDE